MCGSIEKESTIKDTIQYSMCNWICVPVPVTAVRRSYKSNRLNNFSSMAFFYFSRFHLLGFKWKSVICISVGYQLPMFVVKQENALKYSVAKIWGYFTRNATTNCAVHDQRIHNNNRLKFYRNSSLRLISRHVFIYVLSANLRHKMLSLLCLSNSFYN